MSDLPMTPVKGYRPLTEQQQLLVNHGKELEELVLRHLERVDDYLRSQGENPNGRMKNLAHGRMQLQDAFMWVNRSIMNPQRIELPEDREDK